MSIFKFVDRTCEKCGAEYEALEFWTRILCDRCLTLERDAHMAEINAVRGYRVSTIGGACPTQATGRTATGRPFYFRARHGDWTLQVGDEVAWPEDYAAWPGFGMWLGGGNDETGGFMEEADVLAILDKHIGEAP